MEKESKLKHALRLVREGMNPHAAAKVAECPATHVYKALKTMRLKAEGRCQCCGQKLPTSEKPIDT